MHTMMSSGQVLTSACACVGQKVQLNDWTTFSTNLDRTLWNKMIDCYKCNKLLELQWYFFAVKYDSESEF